MFHRMCCSGEGRMYIRYCFAKGSKAGGRHNLLKRMVAEVRLQAQVHMQACQLLWTYAYAFQ